jgi:hypothetical protein
MCILQGLGAYNLATIVVSDIAECGYLFSQVVVSSGLAPFFFSHDFILLVLRAVNTQILSTFFVTSTRGLLRFRATAILAGLRKGSVPTFFKAAAVVSAFIAVFWPAFWLLDVPGHFDDPTLRLLGAAPYFAGSVAIAVVCQCRLACAVPVPEDASDSLFGAVRSGLKLIGAGNFYAAAAMLALLDGIFVAVLTAFPSQVLAARTAINAVLCAVVALALLLQPVLYLPMAVLTAFRWQVVAAGTANIAVLCMVLVLNMMVRPLLYLYLPSATLTALPRTLPA